MGFETFSDLITFSRTSNATRVDNTGKLTYAPHNLVLYSEEFDYAGWTKVASTITPNAAVGPNGTTTADKLVENTAVTTGHYITPNPAFVPSPTLGQIYVFSVYAKAGERTFIQLIVTQQAPGNGNYIAGFDLTNGTAGAPSATVTSTITDVGDGWYRCSMAYPVSNAISGGYQIRLSLNSTSAPSSYTGDGTSGAFIWGAQFEQVTYQTVPGPYVQTVASAYYGPRFDYNPVTLVPLGLLIEEQRVNLGLYSDELDNAVWTKSLASVTANATTSPDGTANADRLTADGSNNPHDVRQTITYTAAVHTLSVYAKKDTGDFVQLRFSAAAVTGGTGFANFDLNAGTVGTIGAGLSAASITPAGNGWYRCTITGTTNAGTAFFSFYIVSNAAAPSAEGGTFTTSVFLYGAQLEAATFATSYIPTVASQVTRTADTATMTGTNFSSWYNASEGTMVAFFNTTTAVTSVSLGAFGISDGTSNERLSIRRNSGNTNAAFIVVDGGTTQYSQQVTAASGPYRSALAYSSSGFMGVNNGTLATAGTGTLPTVTQAEIGFGQLITRLNGHLSSITYYPTRFTDAQSQALTL
jgi:hypothetical protein